MGRATGRTRIDRRTVDMSAPIDAAAERWTYQPEEHDEELRFESILSEDAVLYVRQLYQRGRLVEFGLTQMTRVGGRWVNVARADSCHGTVHVHRYAKTGEQVGEPRVLVEVFTQEDLEDGYDRADETIEVEWAENVRRWRDGR